MSPDAVNRSVREFAFLRAFGPLLQGLRRVHDREFAPLGVSVAQVHPLLLLHEHGPMRQRELAARLDVEGPTVVRLLDQLEALQLVVRRPDPDDQRAKVVHLTDAGRALAERVLPVIASLGAALLADVTDAELATCLRVFDRLAAAMAVVERDTVAAAR